MYDISSLRVNIQYMEPFLKVTDIVCQFQPLFRRTRRAVG